MLGTAAAIGHGIVPIAPAHTNAAAVAILNRAKTMATLGQFREIWVIDFEYHAPDGCRPSPVCLVAVEIRSGRELRLWRDELQGRDRAPWDIGACSLTIAYYASAELNCFRALGWPQPANVIDLFAEFRAETNGLPLVAGNGLLGALAYFGLSSRYANAKEAMRQLIMAGGQWTPQERADIIEYCADDVHATCVLLETMAPRLGKHAQRIGHAVIRGRYMDAVSAMEHAGIPVDAPTFELLKAGWHGVQDELIREIDRDYGVYDGRTFKADRFARWLAENNLPWPRLNDTGALALDDDTFRSMARAYPQVSALRELRHALGEMRLNSIAVGPDGRNRVLLSPFRSKTGRNQPSNSKFLFGSATWLRGLIKPAEGMAIAYLDFSSQEIAIAAALSGDAALWRAYDSGDPYMQFAIDAKLAPAGASKKTHGHIRGLCKAIVLGVQYGMGPESMATRAGMPVIEARQLLTLHKETYRTFWQWAEMNVARALAGSAMTTPYGWTFQLNPLETPNARSLLNWPMQAAGSDMLRLACERIVKAGVTLCAPVHDALLVEAPVAMIDAHAEIARAAMVRASSMVLNGPACRVDADVYRFPDRYMDAERGAVMWNRVMGLVGGPSWEPNKSDAM